MQLYIDSIRKHQQTDIKSMIYHTKMSSGFSHTIQHYSMHLAWLDFTSGRPIWRNLADNMKTMAFAAPQ